MKQTTKLLLIAVAGGALFGAGTYGKEGDGDICPVTRQFGNSQPAVVFVKEAQSTIALTGHRAQREQGQCCRAELKPRLQADPHGGIRVLYVKQACPQ